MNWIEKHWQTLTGVCCTRWLTKIGKRRKRESKKFQKKRREECSEWVMVLGIERERERERVCSCLCVNVSLSVCVLYVGERWCGKQCEVFVVGFLPHNSSRLGWPRPRTCNIWFTSVHVLCVLVFYFDRKQIIFWSIPV